eukprot:scaffold111554_cov64-Attheya_sp.AAC.1
MPSGGHNRKRKRAPRRNTGGYTCIQCECCRRPFASNHALINHRSLSRPCYDRYFFSSEHTASASSPIAVAGSSGTNTYSNISVRPSSSTRPSTNRRDNASIPLVDTVPISTDETPTEFRDMDEDDVNSDDDKTIEWEESSKSVSSNDDDGNTLSEGIVNNFGTAESDDDSSLGSDSTVPIPIGGNAAMRAQMHEMHSKQTVIPLEGGGLDHITHFNFEAMLNSLLSDPRIRDSLIVNWDNPSKGVRRDPSHVSDVHMAK